MTYPAMGEAASGARFLVGINAPGMPAPRPPFVGAAPLPGGYLYERGTTACVCDTDSGPYLVTAAHVVAGNVFGATFGLPDAERPLMIGFSGTDAREWLTGPPFVLRPDFVTRWTDGAVIDAVGIPLPEEFRPGVATHFAVPDAEGLVMFENEPAFARVERGGELRELAGRIERVTGPGEARLPGAPRALLPECVSLRFDGDGTEAGDSGAPIICRRDGVEHLLGIHFVQEPIGMSMATAAWAVFEHLNLRPS